MNISRQAKKDREAARKRLSDRKDDLKKVSVTYLATTSAAGGKADITMSTEPWRKDGDLRSN